MTVSPRRGWCPSLGAPMATGDGLLARLAPRHGLLSPRQLEGVARAAGEHGNAQIEITMRGNLQIRGLTEESAPRMADAVAALGIEAEALPEIRISPLASFDEARRGELSGMAGDIRAHLSADGLAERLAPKFAIAIDEAERPGLASLSADIRLTRLGPSGGWLLAIGGDARSSRPLGEGDRGTAIAAALICARAVAELGRQARARDLPDASALAAMSGLCKPRTSLAGSPGDLIGCVPLPGGSMAVGLALPFGQIEAEDLGAFSRALAAEALVCLAPDHALLVGRVQSPDAVLAAARPGFIAAPGDVRLRILACAGSPACASGHLATRPLARLVTSEASGALSDMPALYIAGCAKQCGKPAGPHVAIIGEAGGIRFEERDAPLAQAHRQRLHDLSKRVAMPRRAPA